MNGTAPIVGVILAGGMGRRMGGSDKPLVAVGGRPMLDRVAERLAPQVGPLLINANGDPSRFAGYGLPVVPDTIGGFAGPLAGILAGMRWAEANGHVSGFIASAAADTPFFPSNLVSRLAEASGGDHRSIALAASADGVHPAFGLWPVALADDLESFLGSGVSAKILAFVDRHRRADAFFGPLPVPGGETFDPFFNVNTPEEAGRAEEIARALDGPAR